MAFYSHSVKVKSLAHAIHKFQHNTGNKKASCINFTLQELVNCVAATKPINLPLFDVSKRKTKVAVSASSCFYDFFWLTNTNKFPRVVAHFNKIIANSQIMDSSLQQSIISTVTFAVATAIAAVQAKYESEMFSL